MNYPASRIPPGAKPRGDFYENHCEECGKPTKAADPYWTIKCPEHWQAFARRVGVPAN